MPQFSTLTVSSTGTVTAMPWDGARGGIVALHVRDTLTLQGSIDVTGLGFRGGQADNLSSAVASTDVAGYRAALGMVGAEKGEGIAGFQLLYDTLGGPAWRRGSSQRRRRWQRAASRWSGAPTRRTATPGTGRA